MGISPLSQIEGDYLTSIPLLGAALAGLRDLTRRLTWGAPSAKLNETAISRPAISRT